VITDVPESELLASILQYRISQPDQKLIDPDPDPGPFFAWHEASKCRLMRQRRISDHCDIWFRWRAYAMWDRERIKTEFAHTLGAEWPRGVRNPLLEYTSEEQEQMYWSFVIRSQIWQRGGLGYWSEGDLSRIQWSSGKPPSDIDDAINKAVEQ
jgi:hypothetical protein